MKPKHRFVNLRRHFIANPRTKNQKYCNRAPCQLVRKTCWISYSVLSRDFQIWQNPTISLGVSEEGFDWMGSREIGIKSIHIARSQVAPLGGFSNGSIFAIINTLQLMPNQNFSGEIVLVNPDDPFLTNTSMHTKVRRN